MNEIPSKRTKGDIAHAAVRAGLGSIPIAGNSLSVLFETAITAPLDARKTAWLEEMGRTVFKIQAQIKELTPEALAKNEAWVTTAVQASQLAVRNHQEEKLAALRNAVFNAALPGAPDSDFQAIFLHLIDTLTPWHLRLLAMLHDPVTWMTANSIKNPGWGMGGGGTVIEHCFPQLRTERELYSHWVRELQAAGLVTRGEFIGLTMSGSGMVESRTTPLGNKFLAFISEPK